MILKYFTHWTTTEQASQERFDHDICQRLHNSQLQEGTTVISGRLPARPITRTGWLLHAAKKKVNRLPALVDNPHVVIQLFGGENVTLRWYISVF